MTSVPIIPRQVVVHRTENVKYTHGRVSNVRHYDGALSLAFPLFLLAEPEVVGRFTEALGRGFSDDGFGPFWPSFASVHSGHDDLKVLWLSESALRGLRTLLGVEFYFRIEDRAAEIIEQEEGN